MVNLRFGKDMQITLLTKLICNNPMNETVSVRFIPKQLGVTGRRQVRESP
ncbi:Uncharacterised protein [Vibrio cholerae]|nr:Uncharacterised protein [Vibrio cholerae]